MLLVSSNTEEVCDPQNPHLSIRTDKGCFGDQMVRNMASASWEDRSCKQLGYYGKGSPTNVMSSSPSGDWHFILLLIFVNIFSSVVLAFETF